MTIWHLILGNIERNWADYTAGLSVLFVAGVCVMPPKFPKSFQEWWTWLRDTLQTAIPAARHKEPVLPQDPATDSKEK